MKILKEFRDFIGSGNVTDLAVGVTVGNALGHFVRSVVNDTITLITGVIGKVDFRNYYWVIYGDVPKGASFKKAQDIDGALVLGVGSFATELINALILTAVVYVIVRAVNQFRKKESQAPTPQEPPAPPADVALLTEIRDLLRNQALTPASVAAPPTVSTPPPVPAVQSAAPLTGWMPPPGPGGG